MTSEDILKCVELVDQRKKRGENQERDEKGHFIPSGSAGPIGRSANHTAEIVGVSSGTVKRVRTILDHGTPETIEAVKKGEKSIKKAATEINAERRASKQAKSPKPFTPPPPPTEPVINPDHERLWRGIAVRLENIRKCISELSPRLQGLIERFKRAGAKDWKMDKDTVIVWIPAAPKQYKPTKPDPEPENDD